MSTGTPDPSGYPPRRRPGRGHPVASPGRAARLRPHPAGGMRVSDADRDAALSELSQHFQAGRLTAEELDDRTGRILAARTGDELDGPLSDLPVLGPPSPAAPPAGSRAGARPPRPRPARSARAAALLSVLAVAVITAVLALGLSHGHHGWPDFLPVLAIILVVRRVARGHDHS